ncbi:MAG: exonuclease SbcCD subunit D [Candidatus Gastranaerophilaceae bacterium]
MEFSFIHTADIHLGRVFSGVKGFSNDTSGICEKAFFKIVDTAIERNVDFVLIAGDSFDDVHDIYSKSVFYDGLKRLKDNNIKVFAVCGNHDPAPVYTDIFTEEDDFIKIVGVNTEQKTFDVYNNHELNCVIHAFSFSSGCEKNPLPAMSEKVTGVFNIGLLHCDPDGSPSSPYAPCPMTELRELGYDYYALGHVHKRFENENIVMPGTPQGCDFGEPGAHGCMYVKVSGGKCSKEFIPTDFAEYDTETFDITGVSDVNAVNEITKNISNKNDDKIRILTLTLQGKTGYKRNLTEKTDEIKKAVNAKLPENVFIASIIDETAPEIDKNVLNTASSGLPKILYELAEDEDLKTEIIGESEKMLERVFLQGQALSEEAKTRISQKISSTGLRLCEKIYCEENNE